MDTSRTLTRTGTALIAALMALTAYAGSPSLEEADEESLQAGPYSSALHSSHRFRQRTGPNIDMRNPVLHLRTIRPDDVDAPDRPADAFLEDQYAVLDTRAERMQGRLVVFLAGATSPPDRTMSLYLASLGFHVLAPHYSNAYGLNTICPPNPDPDCHRLGRQEAFEGRDLSPFIQISRGNSIEERVVRMLKHLAVDMPEGDWGFFLRGNLPRWDRITISGTSHGASTAGLIGKIRRTERVVLLSGPFDNIDGVPAAWTRRQPLTSVRRFFAFSHTADSQFVFHIPNLEAMGLFGEPTSVDTGLPEGCGSHRLVTSADSPDGHSSTKAGETSPKNPDGSFRFDPVWRYLFGVK